MTFGLRSGCFKPCALRRVHMRVMESVCTYAGKGYG
jgi:hypothetical protein